MKRLKEAEEKENADYDAAAKEKADAAGEIARSLEAKAMEAVGKGERGVDTVLDIIRG